MATGLPVASGEFVDLSYLNGVARGYWRKTTAKVVSTTAEVDLLNSEFIVPANALASNRGLRLTAWGDAVFTSGAAQKAPQFKFKMGSGPTTIIDTNATATLLGTGATRGGWRIVVELMAQGATNAQWASLNGFVTQPGIAGTIGSYGFTTGEGGVRNVGGSIVDYAGGNAATIDMTVAQAVLLTVITGSNTSTDVTLKAALMEII